MGYYYMGERQKSKGAKRLAEPWWGVMNNTFPILLLNEYPDHICRQQVNKIITVTICTIKGLFNNQLLYAPGQF
jgi:hypothetical protein